MADFEKEVTKLKFDFGDMIVFHEPEFDENPFEKE